MYTTFFSVALFFGLAINAVFADFAVSSPDIHACSDAEVNFSWEKTTGPYSVLLVSAEDPCGDPIMDLGDTKDTVISMKTNKLKVGQKVQISIEDAQGEEAWSSDITVQKCVAASSAAASSAAASSVAASSVASSGVASSSAVAASSSAFAGPVAATTLIVTPTLDVTGSPSDAQPSPSVAPIGAANDANPFDNAASVPRHISIPAVALSVVAGVVALL